MRSKSFVLAFGLFLILNQDCLAQVAQEFRYNSLGRRDPFIPLLDKDSPTGLRTIFTRVIEEIQLPMAIEVKGILWNGEEYFAIVNEQVVKKGQYLGEVKIAAIEKNKIIAVYAQKEFMIFLREEKKK